MHLHHRLEIIDAHLVEEAVAQDAGIVDDAVDAPEALDRLAHDAFGGGGIGDAGAIGDGLAPGGADGVHHLMSGLLILARAIGAAAQIVDHDPGALGGGQQRDLAPDAAARPGDDDDLALQRTVSHRAPHQTVIPAKAGIQGHTPRPLPWIPAFAGMTGMALRQPPAGKLTAAPIHVKVSEMQFCIAK